MGVRVEDFYWNRNQYQLDCSGYSHRISTRMNHLQHKFTAFALITSLVLAPISGVAMAHGEMGDHVDNPAAHMSDYEQEITDMVNTSQTIVAEYEQGEAAADDMDALVGTWETLEFHEAVETHAMKLYPPIWVALGNLRQALDKDSASAEVHQAQQQLAAALHEGLGALKFIVAENEKQADEATANHADESAAPDDRPTVTIIQDNLRQALDQYRDGEAEAARKLIYDTYMQRFEGIEGDLIEQDADLVTGLEADFNATLPELMKKGAPADKVEAQVEAMNADLDRAQTLLDKAEQQQGEVF